MVLCPKARSVRPAASSNCQCLSLHHAGGSALVSQSGFGCSQIVVSRAGSAGTTVRCTRMAKGAAAEWDEVAKRAVPR